MYTSLEKNAADAQVTGKVLGTLEFTKIKTRLLSMASSPLGRQICAKLFPSKDVDMVVERLQETRDTVTYFSQEGPFSVSGVNDIGPALDYACSGGVLSMKDLLDIASFLRSVYRIAQSLQKKDIKNNMFCARIRLLLPDNKLEQELSFCILSEEEMNDRASDALYSIRRKIKEAQSGIRDTLDKIIRNHASSLQEQLITMRSDRYVLPVRTEKRSDIPGIIHDTSASGQTVFIEPIAVVEANNRIREYQSAEREEMHRIMQRLSDRVASTADTLKINMAHVAEIDFMSAKARLALAMEATFPILNNEGRILLKKARHPLIDPKHVVPIDFEVGVSFRTLVVTGPNTGGKTVSLKTCGLLTLMAMAGLFIPCADQSEISVFGKVLADIGDEQSIEQNLSTFSSHMKNLVSILSQADESTLVLVDELGSGTDPSEGAALATAILDEFYKRGAVTVATTHYKELKAYAINTKGVENACCEFDTDTLSPTYRLLVGHPGVSNAFVISEKLGLPQKIIQAARSFLSEESLRFEELLSSAEQKNKESEKLHQETRRLFFLAQKQEEDFIEQKRALEEEKEKIIESAQKEKKNIITKTLAECELILTQIREELREESHREAEQTLQKIRRNLRSGLRDLASETKDAVDPEGGGEKPENIQLGQNYFTTVIGATGTLTQMPDRRGNCVIETGGVLVTVPRESLRKSVPVQGAKRASRSHKMRAISTKNPSSAEKLKMEKARNTMPELILIGKVSDEALIELDRHLDDCMLSGIKTTRIVHGKGAGVLRLAVSNMLQKDPRISSFRLGGVGEGGDGVTIATL